jgi:hypothetical protein
MAFDRVKLQKTPEGKYMIIALDPQSGRFDGSDELSAEEVKTRLREKSSASEGDIKRLFAEAEIIAPAQASILEDEEEE